jgi:hypothetical protein
MIVIANFLNGLLLIEKSQLLGVLGRILMFFRVSEMLRRKELSSPDMHEFIKALERYLFIRQRVCGLYRRRMGRV